MNKLLKRLLNKNKIDESYQKELGPLINALSEVFDQNDQDRHMLERSLMLTSDELNDINKQLKLRLAKQKALFNASPEAIVSFRMDGTIEQINRTALDFINLPQDEALKLNTKETLIAFMNQIQNPTDFFKEIRYGDATFNHKLSGYFSTNKGNHYHYQSEPEISNGKTIGRVFCFRDITDLKKNQELLKHRAFHDELTGLPNRSYLIESLEHAIRIAKRQNQKVAVLFIDLDNFKKINDTSGHEQGDKFLSDISLEIQNSLRESDILGRLGGDEFLIIQEDIKNQSQTIEIHDRILKLFNKPFVIKGNEYIVTASIGIAQFPQDGSQPDELIRKADMAMYEAKKMGKNTFHYFDDSLERIAIHRVKTEAELRNAISTNQFILHYQPKIDLTTKEMMGVEALIRWKKPTGEIVYPDNFIPLAEDTGLITDLSLWVVKEACERLSNWKNSCLSNTGISINLSASDFSNPEFIAKSLNTIQSYDIDPKLLEIELTETVLLENILNINQVIAKFKEYNIKISIDDFGTGYSSFSYLQDLSIDYLKIDKSFISNVKEKPRSLAIVKSIIDIGCNLGLSVIAEGIENEYELNQLIKAGCHMGQGYLFSKPIDESSLLAYKNQG